LQIKKGPEPQVPNAGLRRDNSNWKYQGEVRTPTWRNIKGKGVKTAKRIVLKKGKKNFPGRVLGVLG